MINLTTTAPTAGYRLRGIGQSGSLISGVSTSLALIDTAIAQGTDGALVHHGFLFSGSNWLGDYLTHINGILKEVRC